LRPSEGTLGKVYCPGERQTVGRKPRGKQGKWGQGALASGVTYIDRQKKKIARAEARDKKKTNLPGDQDHQKKIVTKKETNGNNI